MRSVRQAKNVQQRLPYHPTASWCSVRAGDQYSSLHQLLGEFTAYSTRAPYAAWRPSGRPRGAASARSWWQYAGRVVRSQLKHSLSWDDISQVGMMSAPDLSTAALEMHATSSLPLQC